MLKETPQPYLRHTHVTNDWFITAVGHLWWKCLPPLPPPLTRSKCESALLERLQLATDVALQAGAAMKAVINLKKEGIVLKGATDL